MSEPTIWDLVAEDAQYRLDEGPSVEDVLMAASVPRSSLGQPRFRTPTTDIGWDLQVAPVGGFTFLEGAQAMHRLKRAIQAQLTTLEAEEPVCEYDWTPWTTNSGKSLFKCSECGHETPAPTKGHKCPDKDPWARIDVGTN